MEQLNKCLVCDNDTELIKEHGSYKVRCESCDYEVYSPNDNGDGSKTISLFNDLDRGFIMRHKIFNKEIIG